MIEERREWRQRESFELPHRQSQTNPQHSRDVFFLQFSSDRSQGERGQQLGESYEDLRAIFLMIKFQKRRRGFNTMSFLYSQSCIYFRHAKKNVQTLQILVSFFSFSATSHQLWPPWKRNPEQVVGPIGRGC